MMHKTKFENIPTGEPFLLNGILFTKSSDSTGVSDRLGLFTIYPKEVVEVFMEPDYVPKANSIMLFATVWLCVMIALYLFAEYCL